MRRRASLPSGWIAGPGLSCAPRGHNAAARPRGARLTGFQYSRIGTIAPTSTTIGIQRGAALQRGSTPGGHGATGRHVYSAEQHPMEGQPAPARHLDRAGFERLFRERYAGLCAFARRYVRDAALAEELVQDVFLALWQRRHALERRDSIAAYLFTSVRNAALNQLKHREVARRFRRDAALAAAPRPVAADEVAHHNELAEALEAAIADLPEKARLALTLSRDAGLTYAQIAETLGVSVKAVEANVSRALRLLRERLAPYLEDRD